MEAEVRDSAQEVLVAPRKRIFYGWYIVGAGMGIHLWMSIAWVYGMQIFFTPLTETFGWSRALISGAFSLQRLEGSLLTPIEGFLVDRYGPRIIVLAGGILAGLGLVFLSFIQAIWMFYVGVLIVSMGLSMAVGIPRTWSIVQWFSRQRGRAMGIGSSGAVISGPLLIIVVWLVATFGWRQAFFVLGITTWVIVLPLAFVFRSRPEAYGYLPDGDAPDEPEAQSTSATSSPGTPRVTAAMTGLTTREAVASPVFWILILVFAAQTMGVNALIVHLIPYLESPDVGFSTTVAASVLGSFTLLSAIGRLGAGSIMDYVDKRIVLAGLLVCQAIAMVILANVSSYWHTIPFAFFYGIAFGGMIPARGIIISAFFGRRSFGAIQGLSQSGTILGGMIAPIYMGWMFDTQGTYIPALYTMAIIAVAAIPLTLFARMPRQMREQTV